MDIQEIESKVQAIQAPLESLAAKEESLLGPIREQLAAIRAEYSIERTVAAEKLGELWAQFTLEDFADPLKAILIYELAWNKGQGISGIDKHIKELTKDSYVIAHHSFYGAYSDDDSGTMAFTVAIPAVVDDTKLQYTAAILEPIYRTAAEISSYARIDILEDSLSLYESYAIRIEDDQWVCRGSYAEYATDKTLYDLLKKIPTYK